IVYFFFFFSSRRRHTRFDCDWSSDVCSSDLLANKIVFTCDDDFIRQAHALAKEHQTLLHFHCSEGTYEPEQCLKKYGHRTIEHRSEERRVGKEWRRRGAYDDWKKKKKKMY